MTTPRNLRQFAGLGLCLVVALCLSACSKPQKPKPASSFAAADLAKLRWIEGQWRGTDERGGSEFFERYRFKDDAHIEMGSFTDATFAKQGDTGKIWFEKGEILHQGGDLVWAVSRLTDSLVEFAPKGNAVNSFVWQQQSPDLWKATLTTWNEKGKVSEIVYRMERVRQ